jgi:upstream activation factor subunit UAF30
MATKSEGKGAAKTDAADKTSKKSASKSAPKSEAKSTSKSASKSGAKAKETKTASKSTARAKSGGGGRTDGIHAKVQPSGDLGAIVGDQPIPRSEVVSRMWDYIRKNKLQNPDDGREILADDKLEKLFGKKKATMFELNKFISAHVS